MPVILEVRQIALGLIDILIEVTPPVVEALLTFLVTLEQLVAFDGDPVKFRNLEGIAAHIKDVVVVIPKRNSRRTSRCY